MGKIGVELTHGDLVAKVTLDRAEKMNALTVDMRSAYAATIRELGEDQKIRVIIVQGAGEKSFSAGGDIGEFLNLEPHELVDWGKEMEVTEACPKPVIAAIDGFCLGAGFELALACDIRISTEQSLFGLPEIRLGMMPGSGGSQRLMRLIGIGRTKHWLLTGKRVTAKEAEQLGIVTKIVQEKDELDIAIEELIQEFLPLSSLSLRVLKETLHEGANAPLSVALELERKSYAYLRSTHDYEEGVKSYLEKRTPHYKGR